MTDRHGFTNAVAVIFYFFEVISSPQASFIHLLLNNKQYHNMTKKITLQEVNDLRKALQKEIVSLLKERNITELKLEFDDDSQSPTYVVDYCHRYDAWYDQREVLHYYFLLH